MEVFLSWSGERSKEMAKEFDVFLKKLFGNSIKIFFSENDIPVGESGVEEIKRHLQRATIGLFCFTEENAESFWMHFEAGALSINNKMILRYVLSGHRRANAPFDMQASGIDKDGTLKILEQISKCAKVKKQYQKEYEEHWPLFEKRMHEIQVMESKELLKWRLEKATHQFTANLFSHKCYNGNPLFKIICNFYLDHLTENAGMNCCVGQSSVNLPYGLYPEILLAMLKMKDVKVDAIAIVGDKEHFWDSRIGHSIQMATPKDCTRTFVFKNSNDMLINMSVLKDHARGYNVSVMSLKTLTERRFKAFAYDYSIITIGKNKLLARYFEVSANATNEVKDKRKLLQIQFSADQMEVDSHYDAIHAIYQNATPFNSTLEGDCASIVEMVFPEESKNQIRIQMKEMSRYIRISDYDKHEEDHAYYCEMMDSMIRKIHHNGESKVRILELGAGTGIFTRRLLELRNLEIVAVEIDSECFSKLKEKLSLNMFKEKMKTNNITISFVNDDSIRYLSKSNDLRFDFIISSFADHHISEGNRIEYLKGVKSKISPTGKFIVGDEFIPKYSSKAHSYERALKIYHSHIIELAKEAGHAKLVELETAALQSGLGRHGDFKISCEKYEEILNRYGSIEYEKEKIGPLEIHNIGGVYVYILAFK